MNDNKLGIEKAIHYGGGYGAALPILLGFLLIFVALPISIWKRKKRVSQLHQ